MQAEVCCRNFRQKRTTRAAQAQVRGYIKLFLGLLYFSTAYFFAKKTLVDKVSKDKI